MNEKKDLELFYIVPYTKSYVSGGYYRNDDTGCIDYKSGFTRTITDSPVFFDDKEQLLNWFYNNNGHPIPKVYRIKYLGNYLGLTDVIKITNLKDGQSNYYTALSKNYYAKYDEDKSKLYGVIVWNDYYSYRYDSNALFKFEDIYKEFSKRGIKIQYDVYKKDIDKKTHFEFIGDPYNEKEKAKGKKLILYKPFHKHCW